MPRLGNLAFTTDIRMDELYICSALFGSFGSHCLTVGRLGFIVQYQLRISLLATMQRGNPPPFVGRRQLEHEIERLLFSVVCEYDRGGKKEGKGTRENLNACMGDESSEPS